MDTERDPWAEPRNPHTPSPTHVLSCWGPQLSPHCVAPPIPPPNSPSAPHPPLPVLEVTFGFSGSFGFSVSTVVGGVPIPAAA